MLAVTVERADFACFLVLCVLWPFSLAFFVLQRCDMSMNFRLL